MFDLLWNPSQRPDLHPGRPLVWILESDPAQLREHARRHLCMALGFYLGCTQEALGLSFEPGQAPQILRLWQGHAIALSMSYAGRHAVIGFCAGAALGLDLVRVEPVHEWASVARLYLGPLAVMRLEKCPSTERFSAFASEWAALEARGKSVGLGLHEWVPSTLTRWNLDSVPCEIRRLDVRSDFDMADLVLAVATQAGNR